MEINSVHFYDTDAAKTSNWLIQKLGFQLVDSISDDSSLSIAVVHQTILFVVSSPLNSQSPVARYLDSHAEGIFDVCFRVKSLNSLLRRLSDIASPLQTADILYLRLPGWDSLQHTVVAEEDRNYYILPSGKARAVADISNQPHSFSWQGIDHLVLNVAAGQLASAVTHYRSLFGWQIQQTFDIATAKSGLYSQALIDPGGKIQFNINEPTTPNSQIQQFIDCNGGAGIQHLALASKNLIRDVAQMRSHRSCSFLSIPSAYYQQMGQKCHSLSVWEKQQVQQQQILVESQEDSLLMQIFTQPIFSEPTFFLEFIERRQQAKGFGAGNFQALFAAVERELDRAVQ